MHGFLFEGRNVIHTLTHTALSAVSGDGNIGRDIQLCEWYGTLEDHFPPELLL